MVLIPDFPNSSAIAIAASDLPLPDYLIFD
jgi:hypothetical protein